MGRNKIAIKTIENKRQKGITFHRRKHGLIKKAHELSVLTGARVAVLMFDAKDECHLYTSVQDSEEILSDYQEALKSGSSTSSRKPEIAEYKVEAYGDHSEDLKVKVEKDDVPRNRVHNVYPSPDTPYSRRSHNLGRSDHNHQHPHYAEGQNYLTASVFPYPSPSRKLPAQEEYELPPIGRFDTFDMGMAPVTRNATGLPMIFPDISLPNTGQRQIFIEPSATTNSLANDFGSINYSFTGYLDKNQ